MLDKLKENLKKYGKFYVFLVFVFLAGIAFYVATGGSTL